jgi:hypothetical protein
MGYPCGQISGVCQYAIFLERRGGEEPPPLKGGGLTGLSQGEVKIRPWPGGASEEEINRSNLEKS